MGLENYRLAAVGAILALLALRLLGAVERRMGQKCRIFQYQVTARENDDLVRAVHEALERCHFQEGPLSFDRREGEIQMRFGLCNPPARHQEFAEKLRRMPALINLKME